MNVKLVSPLIFILAVFSLLISTGEVLATVGGDKYISDIVFHVPSDSVYYIETDNGGQGCLPIIHSVGVINREDVEIKTCDEVFQQYFSGGGGEEAYRQFVLDTYQNLSSEEGLNYLGSVSLKKNNIDIYVEFISENVSEDGELYASEFEATIFQDGKLLAKKSFQGCSKDQPHIFEGYRIPDTDALAILVSTKGDCLEGGYIKESIFIVGGIQYYDITEIRSNKEKSVTDLNAGNSVVYATGKNIDDNNDDIKKLDNNTDINGTTTISSVSQNKLDDVTILLLATFFITGGALGYIAGSRKSPRS